MPAPVGTNHIHLLITGVVPILAWDFFHIEAEKDLPTGPGSDNPSDPGDSNSNSQKKQDGASASNADLLGEDMDTGNENTFGKTNNTPRHSAAPRGSRTTTGCTTTA